MRTFGRGAGTGAAFGRGRTLLDRRDAVRAPEAYSEARSVAITRTKRRPRRVPPRRHCPKPPQARHADPNANADLSNVKRHHRSSAFSRMQAIATATTKIRLFQRYPP